MTIASRDARELGSASPALDEAFWISYGRVVDARTTGSVRFSADYARRSLKATRRTATNDE